MKKILFILLLFPFFSTAQNNQPRFQNDTLYTSGGYKIYKGQTVQLGTGTSDAGYFTFIKFHPTQIKNNTYSLQNSSILVTKLRAYKYAGADNNSIRINGKLTYKDGKQEETDIVVNFERATEDYDGLPSELIVPEAVKIKRTSRAATSEAKKQIVIEENKKQPTPVEIKNLLIADEIKKLFELYKAGALTKEEYESQKKKLLNRQ
jgi:Short C-terminal domain